MSTRQTSATLKDYWFLTGYSAYMAVANFDPNTVDTDKLFESAWNQAQKPEQADIKYQHAKKCFMRGFHQAILEI